jgi:phage shock protein C
MGVTDRLYRSRDDRMLAGVAGGLAEMFDVDPSLVRIVWAVLIVLTGGLAFLVYVVMAIVVPERPAGLAVGRRDGDSDSAGSATGSPTPASSTSAARAPRADRSDATRGGLIGGLILILVGGFFLVRELLPSFDLGFWWPTVAIALGVLLVVLALIPSRRSD